MRLSLELVQMEMGVGREFLQSGRTLPAGERGDRSLSEGLGGWRCVWKLAGVIRQWKGGRGPDVKI